MFDCKIQWQFFKNPKLHVLGKRDYAVYVHSFKIYILENALSDHTTGLDICIIRGPVSKG